MNAQTARKPSYKALTALSTPVAAPALRIVREDLPPAAPVPLPVAKAPKHTPLQVAQLRLQTIGQLSFQSATTPMERAQYVAELKVAQKNPDVAISSIADYALGRAESAFRSLNIDLAAEAAIIVRDQQQQQPVHPDQNEKNRQAQQQQPQM